MNRQFKLNPQSRHTRILIPAVTYIFALFFVGATRAQKIPLDTAVHTGTLANGFTYYILHNNEPKNRVYLYLVNKVGSVLEDDDQQGLAHFMEHMNFNGTTHFPKNELVSYLQKSSVRFDRRKSFSVPDRSRNATFIFNNVITCVSIIATTFFLDNKFPPVISPCNGAKFRCCRKT